MKILVNRSYGIFGFSKEFRTEYADLLGPRKRHLDKSWRENEEVIAAVETFGIDKASDWGSKLQIVEIPNEVTDWEVLDYDGCEEVIYVLDGRIYHE